MPNLNPLFEGRAPRERPEKSHGSLERDFSFATEPGADRAASQASSADLLEEPKSNSKSVWL